MVRFRREANSNVKRGSHPNVPSPNSRAQTISGQISQERAGDFESKWTIPGGVADCTTIAPSGTSSLPQSVAPPQVLDSITKGKGEPNTGEIGQERG